MSLGSNIKEIRKKQKLKQSELAEKAGISRVAIGNYERGDRIPNGEIIIKIAKALDVSSADLLGEDTQKKINDQIIFEEQLKQLGYSLGFDEEDAYLWINYPDGTLEITDDDLRELIAGLKSFLKFQLAELKLKHIEDFRER